MRPETHVRDLAARARVIADEITLPQPFGIVIGHDDQHEPGRHYYQISCWRPDTFTGEMARGYGGKAYLSPHATDSELVQTVFGLFKAYVEHEAREAFQWRGRRVFGPHIDTAALWEVADRLDARSLREDRAS